MKKKSQTKVGIIMFVKHDYQTQSIDLSLMEI